MNYEGYMELVRARRSVRAYKRDAVADELIDKIIEAGKWAPCGNNIRVLEVIVLKDRALIEKIEKITGQGLEPSIIQHFNAPVMLVIIGDTRLCEMYFKGFLREEILSAGLTAAIENMLLAATALGLGSVYKTVAPYAAGKIKDLLGIPPFYVLKTLIPVGYAEGVVQCPPKMDVVVHVGRFDGAKLPTEQETSEISEKYCTAPGLNKVRAF